MVPAHAGGVDLSDLHISEQHQPGIVPAHAGGVDLSSIRDQESRSDPVPAHAGGVDLSQNGKAKDDWYYGPRPCGRGGFKQQGGQWRGEDAEVPAHAGGVDLSLAASRTRSASSVPAHAGGVDLSMWAL